MLARPLNAITAAWNGMDCHSHRRVAHRRLSLRHTIQRSTAAATAMASCSFRNERTEGALARTSQVYGALANSPGATTVAIAGSVSARQTWQAQSGGAGSIDCRYVPGRCVRLADAAACGPSSPVASSSSITRSGPSSSFACNQPCEACHAKGRIHRASSPKGTEAFRGARA